MKKITTVENGFTAQLADGYYYFFGKLRGPYPTAAIAEKNGAEVVVMQLVEEQIECIHNMSGAEELQPAVKNECTLEEETAAIKKWKAAQKKTNKVIKSYWRKLRRKEKKESEAKNVPATDNPV